jgi:hypothetical protein
MKKMIVMKKQMKRRIQLLVVKSRDKGIFRRILFIEIEDGEDESIEHEDDFLNKLKGKV